MTDLNDEALFALSDELAFWQEKFINKDREVDKLRSALYAAETELVELRRKRSIAANTLVEYSQSIELDQQDD